MTVHDLLLLLDMDLYQTACVYHKGQERKPMAHLDNTIDSIWYDEEEHTYIINIKE